MTSLIEKGFSLLECLVVLSIALILLCLAVPSFHALLARNKTKHIVDRLMNTLSFARAEAIQRGGSVSFCASSQGSSCDGDWSKGQIVLAESNSEVLRQLPALSPGDRLIWRSNLGQNDRLAFAATGFTKGQHGSFYYCPKRGQVYNPQEFGAIIVVAQSGRMRVEQDQQKLETNCY